MNPQMDILEGTHESMTKRVTGILRDCAETDICGMGLKISALNAYGNEVDRAVQQIKMFVRAVREVSGAPDTWLQTV